MFDVAWMLWLLAVGEDVGDKWGLARGALPSRLYRFLVSSSMNSDLTTAASLCFFHNIHPEGSGTLRLAILLYAHLTSVGDAGCGMRDAGWGR